jgi:hypothetical protein
VTPVIETNCHWHTCRLMVFSVQTAFSPSELPSVGEAEAGTAGERQNQKPRVVIAPARSSISCKPRHTMSRGPPLTGVGRGIEGK